MLHNAQLFSFIGVVMGMTLLSSCGGNSARSQIIMPGIDKRTIEWNEKEVQQIYSFKTLHSAAGTSTHALRLAGRSESRVHDHHDLIMVVLAGSADVRLAGKWHSASAGDIIEIPRGSIYQIDRLGSTPLECYVQYYPPYDGKDVRYVTGK
jgi:mannose-6-phosphate isomerase-like protein (cupin superfamily)